MIFFYNQWLRSCRVKYERFGAGETFRRRVQAQFFQFSQTQRDSFARDLKQDSGPTAALIRQAFGWVETEESPNEPI